MENNTLKGLLSFKPITFKELFERSLETLKKFHPTTTLTVGAGVHHLRLGDVVEVGGKGTYRITEIDYGKSEITIDGNVTPGQPVNLVAPKTMGFAGIDLGVDEHRFTEAKEEKPPANLTRPHGEWKIN
jgi:hypothetical protein